MTLKDKLMEDLKASMKNKKDSVRKNTITMIRAAIKQLRAESAKRARG